MKQQIVDAHKKLAKSVTKKVQKNPMHDDGEEETVIKENGEDLKKECEEAVVIEENVEDMKKKCEEEDGVGLDYGNSSDNNEEITENNMQQP